MIWLQLTRSNDLVKEWVNGETIQRFWEVSPSETKIHFTSDLLVSYKETPKQIRSMMPS